jgi:hypothetical protein
MGRGNLKFKIEDGRWKMEEGEETADYADWCRWEGGKLNREGEPPLRLGVLAQDFLLFPSRPPRSAGRQNNRMGK